MALKDLVPWKKARNEMALRRGYEDPFAALRRQMNELFDDIFGGSELGWFGGMRRAVGLFEPRIDVTEDEKEIRISTELPGMDDKDIEVTLSKDYLAIKGEKKQEHEEEGKDYYRRERSYGSFHRVIALPAEVDDQKAEAEFKKGVLKIKLPKTAAAVSSRKRIEVKGD